MRLVFVVSSAFYERYENMKTIELEIAKETVNHLRGHGVVEMQYITAQFEPYTRHLIPDIVFWPTFGSNRGQAFVIELHMQDDNKQVIFTNELLKHREFVVLGAEVQINYALATSQKVSSDIKSSLAILKIMIFDEIKTGIQLAVALLDWSNT